MSKETELTVELISLLNKFKDTHINLVELLDQDSAYPLWIQSSPDPVTARHTLKNLVLNWSYETDDQEAGKTLQHNGLAPCSQATFMAVEAVNNSRLALHQQLIKIDRFTPIISQKKGQETGGSSINGNNKLSKKILQRLGYPRLNIRQACRQFVALPYPVLSAGFFWNRYRKTIKLNRQQILEKLNRLAQSSSSDEAFIQADIERFNSIDDSVLVRIYPESIHQRVNLYIQKEQQEQRIQRYAHTPIFYVSTPDKSLPDKTLLPELPAAKETRLLRRNITVEREPYLTSLNLYRLLPKYR
jgi:hypothetical protein